MCIFYTYKGFLVPRTDKKEDAGSISALVPCLSGVKLPSKFLGGVLAFNWVSTVYMPKKAILKCKFHYPHIRLNGGGTVLVVCACGLVMLLVRKYIIFACQNGMIQIYVFYEPNPVRIY